MIDTNLNYNFGYTVVGYDKDEDVLIEFGEHPELGEAVSEAKKLTNLINGECIRRVNEDPIDWIEVYLNYGFPGEKLVWASYRDFKNLDLGSHEVDRMRYVVNERMMTQINIEINSMDEDYTVVFLVPEEESEMYYHKLWECLSEDRISPEEACNEVDGTYYMCKIYDDRVER